MSAKGQKLPRRLIAAVSALPPKADTNQRTRRVRFGPKAGIGIARRKMKRPPPGGPHCLF
jgi:hypothetical protein